MMIMRQRDDFQWEVVTDAHEHVFPTRPDAMSFATDKHYNADNENA